MTQFVHKIPVPTPDTTDRPVEDFRDNARSVAAVRFRQHDYGIRRYLTSPMAVQVRSSGWMSIGSGQPLNSKR